MKNLIHFIFRHGFIILFLLLEIVSIELLIQHNIYHRAGYIRFSHAVNGYISTRVIAFKDYLSLKKINNRLNIENVELRNTIARLTLLRADTTRIIEDTIRKKQYRYIPARVVNNSVNKQYNYITIDKGSADGIRPEMGVATANGIAGVVHYVSPHYATVISVLNTRLKISAKIKKNNFFGSLSWTGTGTAEAILNEIPYHAPVAKGDTIVTSGYSVIFPENIYIGVISDYDADEGNFYTIHVKLSTDFRNLSYVYIIENILAQEKQQLENIPEPHD